MHKLSEIDQHVYFQVRVRIENGTGYENFFSGSCSVAEVTGCLLGLCAACELWLRLLTEAFISVIL